jgi:DNA-binding NtrC family response regulator
VHVADTVASGLDRLNATRFAALICDVRMPGASGMDLIPDARRIDDDLAILMLTGLNDAAVATEALALGAADYLLKPVELDRLEKAIRRALRRRDDRIAQRALEQRVHDGVARLLAAQVERATAEDLTAVLRAVVAALESREAHRRDHSEWLSGA